MKLVWHGPILGNYSCIAGRQTAAIRKLGEAARVNAGWRFRVYVNGGSLALPNAGFARNLREAKAVAEAALTESLKKHGEF